MYRLIAVSIVLLAAIGCVTTALAQSSPAIENAGAGKPVRIDQMQWVGTHNSYHIAPDRVAMSVIELVARDEARAIDCTQRPLVEQLERLGMRHFELDLFRDPDGTLYRSPLGYQMAKTQQADVPEFDPDQKLHQAGIKVLHSPDFDFRTHVYTLRDALLQFDNWMKRHPQDGPIFVLLELKAKSFSPATVPLPWTADAIGELERLLLEVFGRQRILAPDDVRAGRPTLREAVQGVGWPSVDSCRGKIIFLLDNEGAELQTYLAQSPILEQRVMFASVPSHHPAAAWMKRNDPIANFAEIVSLVEQGFLVRTRADSGTTQARNNDTARRDHAIRSGAQLISTDYPEPDRRFSEYFVSPKHLLR